MSNDTASTMRLRGTLRFIYAATDCGILTPDDSTLDDVRLPMSQVRDAGYGDVAPGAKIECRAQKDDDSMHITSVLSIDMTGPVADITAPRPANPSTPEHTFVEAVRHRNYAAALKLLDTVDINVCDPETGATALHFIAARRFWKFLRRMEASGRLRYLLRDASGRYPSELAWMYADDSELGDYLDGKEAEEARINGTRVWPDIDEQSKSIAARATIAPTEPESPFDVGDYVCDPEYGVGKVISMQREESRGHDFPVAVIKYADPAITVPIPIDGISERAHLRLSGAEAEKMRGAQRTSNVVHLRVRPGLMDIAPNKRGDLNPSAAQRPIRLASNESPLGASLRAVHAYRRHSEELHRYPDGSHEALRSAIAAQHRLPAEQIVCGAGSDELITLLVRAYAGPGHEVLHNQYAFLMYHIAARSVGASPIAAPETDYTANVDAMLAHVTPRTRVVFLANPNNPTGTVLPAAEVRRLHAGLPENVLFVLDSAYAEYARGTDYEDGSALVSSHSNVVMLRTFSKIYGLAGLRVGWAYCPPEVADVLNRVRNPFNVSAPAQAAAAAALEDQDHVQLAKAHNDRWLPWFHDQVVGLGFTLVPSAANFIMIRFPAGPATNADAAYAFLSSHDISVRKLGAYGLSDSLRITIGAADDMQVVSGTLSAFTEVRPNLRYASRSRPA